MFCYIKAILERVLLHIFDVSMVGYHLVALERDSNRVQEDV